MKRFKVFALTFAFLFTTFLTVKALASESCVQNEDESRATHSAEISSGYPAYLKGATITVKLADGRSSTVPAEKFKVVPRLQQFVVDEITIQKTTVCTNNAPRKNRVSGMVGHGAQEGLTSSKSASTSTVESNVGIVGGAQYQRVLPLLDDRISIGVQGQTNKTGSVLLGLDF